MAKALFGHVGNVADGRLRDEIARLRGTVRTLEFESARLRADNDRLRAELADHESELRARSHREEPVLT
jgi:regulator of replication initiation timing